MGKKKLIQIFLFILLILITFLIFNIYYKTDKTFESSKEIEFKSPEQTKPNVGKNIIQDIRYTSNNSNGDIFEILADYGEPSDEIDDLMFLTKVIANITLKNKSDIKYFLNNYQDVSHCKMLLSKDINFLGLKKEKGDFNLKRNVVTNFKSINEKLYYSGLQIVSKNIFNNKNKIFSMNKIWSKLIKKKQIEGYVIGSKIRHIGDKKSILEN